jgi:large subunit ribosomal protein L25
MTLDLSARTRTVLGKKVRSLRAAGTVPAEVFGHGKENRHIGVSAREFEKVFREAGEHSIVTLTIDEKEKVPTVITDVVRDPLSGTFLSIDFHAIRMDEKIQAKIPVHFTGEAPATKLGFPVVRTLEEIEVEALPGKLPHAFDVDIAALTNPGESIHVGDVRVPADVRVLVPTDTVIVTVGEKTKEEAPAPVPAAAVAPTETATESTTGEAAPAEQ